MPTDLLIEPISQTRAGESGSWVGIAPNDAEAFATALVISPPTGMITPSPAPLTPKRFVGRWVVLEEMFEGTGSRDGFMLGHSQCGPRDLSHKIVDLLVPELQRRGRFSSAYTGRTLRENLAG